MIKLKREQLEEAILETRSAVKAASLLRIAPKTVYALIVKFGLCEEDGSVRVRKIVPRLRAKRAS
jgi:hypothetical protein